MVAEKYAPHNSPATPALERAAAADDWMERTERIYLRYARSSSFCRAQAGLVNSLCELAIADRAPASAAGPAEGCSLRDPVWRRGKTVLYRYRALPFVGRARARPILICYAQVNRPYVLDLDPQRSLIHGLLARGLTIYLIDWGYPDAADSATPLVDYLEGHLGGCVEHVLTAEGVPAIDLLGVCQGGTFSLCFTALHPRAIANLVLMVAPVDFRTSQDLLSRWARGLDPRLIRRAGNMPGVALNAAFLALAPFSLLHGKYARLLASGPTPSELERFLRLERWIFDSPDQPAAAFAQFLQWFYQENRLLDGRLVLRGSRIRLERIRQPVLNIYAARDRIVPPAASRALRGRLGSGDYGELRVESGHVGVFVGRDAARDVPQAVSRWLAARS